MTLFYGRIAFINASVLGLKHSFILKLLNVIVLTIVCVNEVYVCFVLVIQPRKWRGRGGESLGENSCVWCLFIKIN